MNDRASVRNAADPKQVKAAGRLDKKDREIEIDDLRSLLRTEFGRRFVWRLMGRFKWGQAVFDRDPAQMAFNAGVQNCGNFLVAEVTEANDQALLLMMQESAARERIRNNTVDATHTEFASEGGALTQEKSDAQ